MTDTIKISRDELQRIAQGCSCEVTTDALDALLATPPADAADMGGQAGEEVEVRGLIVERDIMGAMHIKLPAYDGGAPIDLVQVQYRYPYTDNASTKRLAEQIAALIAGEPLMTVAQHQRIVAALSAQESAPSQHSSVQEIKDFRGEK